MVHKLAVAALLLVVIAAGSMMWLTYHTKIANAQDNGLFSNLTNATLGLTTTTSTSSTSLTTLSVNSSISSTESSSSDTSSSSTTTATINSTTSSTTTILLNTTQAKPGLTLQNQTILQTLLGNESSLALLVSNSSVPVPDPSATPALNYTAAQQILSNLTSGASGITQSIGPAKAQAKVAIAGRSQAGTSSGCSATVSCTGFLKVRNVSNSISYGGARNGSGYYSTGASLYYIGVDNSTGAVSLYNYTVIKAQPLLSVNINGYNISTPNVTKVIRIAVLNGKAGINGGSTYYVEGNLSTTLLNNLTLSYSVKVGNQTIESSNITTASLDKQISLNVPLNQNTTITFDANGNSNYTSVDPGVIVFPSPINYAVPVNIINSQSSNTPANFQQMVNLNTSKICTAILCAPHLNNTEFFFANGTIINSWYESANGLTNNYASNSFSASSNVTVWTLLPPANYVQANSYNTIYLGFAANSVNNFNSLGTTGEAPQLSLTSGKYDNGNIIFPIYTNSNLFTTTPSGWVGGTFVYRNLQITPPIVVEAMAQYTLANGAWIPIISTSGVSYFFGLQNNGALVRVYGSGTTVTSTLTGIYSYDFVSNTVGNGQFNYGPAVADSGLSASGQTMLPGVYTNGGSTAGSTTWFRTRVYPPSGVMPSTVVGNLLPNPALPLYLTPFYNQAYDFGQSIVFNALESNGISPFTYNFIVYNSVTGVKLANQLYTGVTTTSNTFTWTFNSATTGNTVYANAILTYLSNTATALSGTLTLNNALTTPTISSSPVLSYTIDGGQTITFTSSWSGGTSTYSANYLISNSVTNAIVVSKLFTGISSTSNTFLWTIPSSISGGVEANVVITDSASAAVALNSIYIKTLSINLQPTANQLTPSVPNPQPGQLVVFNVLISGGQGPFTANLVAANGVVVNTVVSSSQGIKTFGILTPPAGISFYNVIVTDTGIVTPYVFNSSTIQLTVSSLSSSPYTPTLSNTVIDVGQVSVANVVISGGIGPYKGEWTFLTSNVVGNNLTAVIPVGGAGPWGIVVNPSGTKAYVVNLNGSANVGTINTISTSTNQVVNTINVGKQPLQVAINPSGTLGYVTNYGSSSVNVINLATNAVINTIATPTQPYGVAFSPSGNLAYVAGFSSDVVYAINVATNSIVNTITVGSFPVYLAFNPQGTLAYISNCADCAGGSPQGYVYVVNVVSNSVVNQIPLTPSTESSLGIAFNPSGTLAYVTTTNSSNNAGDVIDVISTATNTVVNTIVVGPAPEYVSFNPSGTLAYVTNYGGSTGNTISVIDAMNNTVIKTIYTAPAPLDTAFTPSGNTLYVTYCAQCVNIAGSGSTVNIISPSDTAVASLPISSNALTLTVNAISSNTIAVTFNGVTQQFNTPGTATIYGKMALYGYAQDSKTGWAGASGLTGTNTLTIANYITINPALVKPTLVSHTSLLSNVITFTANWSGGTSTYTANYVISNSVTNAVITSQIYTGLTGTSNSFGWTIPSSVAGNTIEANILITDSATTPESANSLYITTPTSHPTIVAYIPITLTNSQSNAIAANTSIAIGTSSTGNIIGFNAIAYQKYETCNLNNAAFIFTNGTTATSWMEGNYINEQTANVACTSTSSTNALSSSANILYWVKIPSSNFLPADTGTPTTNIIWLAWAGNVISTANTLLNLTTTGEAPQLSCNTPTNTLTGCAAGQYGQYDNGNSVFSYYQDFAGNTLPSTWSSTGSGFNTNNGLIISSSPGVSIYTSSPVFSSLNVILESDMEVSASSYFSGLTETSNLAGFGSNPIIAFITPSSSSYVGYSSDGSGSWDLQNNAALFSPTLSKYYVLGSYAIPGQIGESDNYVSLAKVAGTVNANQYIVLGTFSTGQIGGAIHMNYQWVRTRTYPPNGALPSTTYGSVVIPITVSIAPSTNQAYYYGQSIAFTATESGGTSPFTYNFIVYNSVTNKQLANQIYTGVSSTSNTFTWTFNSATAGNTVYANVIVTDTNSNNGISGDSGTFTLNPAQVTFPNGVNYAIPITITDSQSTGTPANFQQMVAFNAINVCNALICASHLNNTEFFTSNGLVLGSWYESAKGLTNNYGSNSFSTSSNVIAWVLLPPANFIPASGSNTIYLGFETNTVNNFNAHGSTGEAPQLTCPNTNAAICGGTYGGYDNGNSIFAFYDDFPGATLNSGKWTSALSAAGGTVTVNNGITITEQDQTFGGTEQSYIQSTSTYANPIIAETYMSLITLPASDYDWIGTFTGTGSTGFGLSSGMGYALIHYGSYTYQFFAGGSQQEAGSSSPNPQIFGGVWSSTASEIAYSNYTSAASATLSQSYTSTFVGLFAGTNSGSDTASFTAPWFRGRIYPPSGVMPSTSLGTLITAPAIPVSITPYTNQVYDYGQSIVFNAVETTGGSPFTFNFLVYNSVTNLQLANQLYSGVTTTSNTFAWNWPSADSGNTIYANVILTYSGSSMVNSTPSGTMTLNPALTIPTLTASPLIPNTLDAGQSITLTSSWSGGTSAYSSDYFLSNSITNTVIASQLYTGLSGTSNTFIWAIPSSAFGNTIEANVIITDSATNQTSANSVYLKTLTINAQPTATLLTPSSSTFSFGQSVTFNVLISGGMGPFTVNLVSANGLVVNTITGASQGITTFGSIIPPAGSDSYNVIATDKGIVVPYTINSTASRITVINLLATPNSATISNTIIDVGQSTVATTVISNGIGPYSGGWTFIPSNTAGNNVLQTINVGAAGPWGIAFNSQGTLAYVVNFGAGAIDVVSTATNSVVNTITVGTGPIGVAINPSGTLAYVTNEGSDSISVISIATNSVIHTISMGTTLFGVAFNPQGNLAYASNFGQSSVSVINVATNTVVNTITVGSSPVGLAFNPQGTLAYVSNCGPSCGGSTPADIVSVINVTTNSVVNTITVNGVPLEFAFNPSGSLVYVTTPNPPNTGGNQVQVINTATNTVVNTITVGTAPEDVAINPQGTLAYVTNYGASTISVINVQTSTVINTINTAAAPLDVAFSPQGTLAYVSYCVSCSIPAGSGTTINSIAPSATAIASLPISSNALTLVANAISSNTISLTFNGVTQQFVTAGTSTLYGTWKLYGFAQDGTTGLAGVTGLTGTNAITVSNAFTINPQPTATSLTPNVVTLLSGNYLSYNVVIGGGTGPFTVNLVLAGSVIESNTGVTSGSTVTFASFKPPAGLDSYNVVATDTGTTTYDLFNSLSNTVNVINSASPLAFNSLTISNSIIEEGQTQKLTAYVYNGVSSYTYNFLVYNALGTLVANQLASNSLTTNAFSYLQNTAWGAGAFTLNIVVTDSNAPATTVYNSLYGYTVNALPSLTLSTAPIAPAGLDAFTATTGNTITFNALVSGGTPPFTYTFYVYNSVTKSVVNSIVTGSTNSLIFTTNTNLVGNTLNANVFVTDNFGATANSILTGTFTVNALPSIALSTTPSPSGIDAGNTITFNAIATSGTPPYTYTFYVYKSVTKSTVNTLTTSSNSFVFTTNSMLVGNTLNANVFVTDSVGELANSILTGTFTVNSIPSITLSTKPPAPAGIDAGNTITFNALATGGTPPFTYTFYVYNSVTYSTVNTLTTASNSLIFTTNSMLVGNTLNANVFVTDAAGFTENSILTGIYTVNSIPSITLATTQTAPAGIDAGNSITFNALASGGTPPYSYTFYVYNSVTHSTVNTLTTSSNSLIFTTNSMLVGNTLNANVFVTDTAGFTVNSILTGTFTINAIPSITLATTPSPSGIDAGNTITFNALASGGTPPFTYIFYIYNSITKSTVNTLTTSSNSFIFTTNSMLVGNTLNANVFVTDNAGVMANSTLTGAFTVNAIPSIILATTPSPSGIDAGNTITFNALASGGTPPFTYTFYVYNSVTKATVNTLTISSNSFVFTTNSMLIGNTLNANVFVTDGAGFTANSLLTGIFTVNALPSITLSPVTNAIDTGQSVRFTNVTTAGTPPLTYSYTVNSLSGVTISGNIITFANAGTFNVLETVTDGVGSSAHSSNSVITVNTLPSITLSTTPSPSGLDAGNTITFNALVTGGTGPFTYTFYVYNSVTHTTLNSIVTGASNSLIFTTNSNMVGNTLNANVLVIDGTGTSVNSILTGAFTINALPSITLSPTTNTIDAGQSVTFTNTTTGGTGPFTYAYTVNSLTGVTINGNTITFANSGTFNVLETVTDHLGLSAHSANSVITVNTLPSITLSPTTNAIDAGQSVTFTNVTSGGTSPFTYAYTVNSLTGVTITGNVITFATAGTFNVLETVTDHFGSLAHSSNSVITVNAIPSITLSPTTNTIDAGQSVRFTNVTSGGTPPFTYAYTVNSLTGVTISGNTITFATASTFNVLETVTDHTGVIASSSNSVVTVNNALSVVAPTLNSTKLDLGQLLSISVPITGGSPSYTYNIIVSNSVSNSVLYATGPQLTSTLTYTTNTIGSFYANAIVVDSAATPVTKNSVYSTVFNVMSAPTATGLTPSSQSINYGNSISFNVLISGGFGPFSANLVSSGGSVVNTVTGKSAGIVMFNSITPLTNTTYNVIATDTGTSSPFVFNSISNTVLVFNAPTTSTTTIPNGGGGGPPPSRSLTLADNVSGNLASSAPVFQVYVTTSSGTTTSAYNQNQLPETVTFPVSATVQFSFVCSFSAGSTAYQSTNVVYGLGINQPCETNVTASSPSYTVLYNRAPESEITNTTTSTSSSSTVTTTTIAGRQIMNSTYNLTSNSSETVYIEGGSVTLNSNSSAEVNLVISNATDSVTPPKSYFSVIAINVVATSLSKITLNVSLNYSCNIPSNVIFPYKQMTNGTWVRVQKYVRILNQTPCSISFRIPPDPIVALFEHQEQTTTSTSIQTTTVSVTTTTPQLATAVSNRNKGVVAIMVIAALLLAYLLYKLVRGRSSLSRTGRHKHK